MPTTRPSANAPQAGQTHIGDYLRTLYRRRWIAGLTLLVVFVYGAFSTLRKTNVYEAVAQILIDKDARRATSLDSVLDSSTYWESDDFYATQMRIMQSRALAARAAAALRLKPETPAPAAPPETGVLDEVTSWVNDILGRPKPIEPPTADESTAEAAMVGGLLGGLDVVRARGTRIVEIHYRSPDPAFAATAANAFAEQYIEQTLEGRIADTEQTSKYLADQIEDYKKRVADSERALQTYREQNNAFGLDNALSSPDRLDLTTRLTQARVERMQKESAYKNVLELHKSDPAKLE